MAGVISGEIAPDFLNTNKRMIQEAGFMQPLHR